MLLDISEKIERATATVLADLAAIANSNGIEFLVVGAMARDLILDSGFGIDVVRATRDIDFGIRVADWNEFERLVALLKDNNWYCAEKQQHRFVHESGVPVDLIPFGAIETNEGQIRWPPHFNETLSVIGFGDAYADRWQLRISAEPLLEVGVASPAGQAFLKMVAWRDRGVARGGRDATDLRLLMERYLDLDNVTRVVEDYPEWLDDNFDYPLVSAKLLGTDVNRCATNTPVAVFNTIIGSLQPDTIEHSLAYAMHRVGNDADLLYCQKLSDAFCGGLRDFAGRSANETISES